MQASPGDGVVGELSVADDPVVKDAKTALLGVHEGLLLDAVHLTHAEAKQSCHFSPLPANCSDYFQLLFDATFITPLKQDEETKFETEAWL